MSDFETKTDYLIETKGLLKDRINSLGGSITSGTTFRDYLVWLDSLYEALEEKTITGLPDSLEGKCEQTGTPTPSSPQPINITTGRQVVSVCGKNCFDGINKETFISAAANQCNVYPGNIGGYTRVNGGKYTISTTTTQNKYRVGCVNTIPGTSLAPCYNGVNKDNTTSTITIDTTGYKYLIVYATDLSAIQVEKGETASTYEEYKGNDYEINLGKNLANLNNIYLGKSINSNDGTLFDLNTRTTLYQIQIKPNTSYYASLNSNYYIGNMVYYKEDKSFLITQSSSWSSTRSFTTPSNAYYISFAMKKTDDTAMSSSDIDNLHLQLEKGSKTSYSPYKTPIYLGKIGTYQDYIFKNTTENPLYDSNLEEGQWYIHKEIGRVVYDGSDDEAWSYLNNYDDNYLYQSLGISVDIENYSTNYLCSHALPNSTSSSSGNIGSYVFNKAFRLRVPSSIATTSGAFKTWLSTHNVEVYYVLNTPTNTLIEDEELINQLNEIEIFTVISEDFYN